MEQPDQAGAVLIVDDERSIRIVLSRAMERMGLACDTACCVEEAKERINEKSYFCVFLDILLPDGSGLDLLESLVKSSPKPSVIIMTAEATMKNTIAAMQKGAYDFITKPFDIEVVALTVKRIIEYRAMSSELARLKSGATMRVVGDEMVGRSAPMQEVFKLIGRSANSDANILITGPTGTGKELVAKALHNSSNRSSKPFVTVNCAAIPGELLEPELFGYCKGSFTGAEQDREGKFLSADGGTILLDEIGDMPKKLQAKILRVLQDGQFYPVGSSEPIRSNARVIASTNRNLADDVARGLFREDLYHRLDVIHMKLPPLSERKADIPLLVDSFLEKIARTLGEPAKTVGPGVAARLMELDWPGNVRQLENLIRRAVIISPGSTIVLEDILPATAIKPREGDLSKKLEQVIGEICATAPEGKTHETVIKQVEKTLIKTALVKSGGVQTRAARELGLNRNTLARKIMEFGLERTDSGDT